MLTLFQILTILSIILATFLVYQALGPRRTNLTFTSGEKAEWNALAEQKLGSWLTTSNIFGTVTSLATVYVFFIGNTNRFGWWVLAAIVTIWGGAFVTNYCTRLLMRSPVIAARLSSDNQSGAVLLSLFWDDDPKAIQTTAAIKWITLVNIAAILWMDFSVFADVSSRLIAPQSIMAGVSLMAVCSFSVLFFTMRYGLRGFVFADLFHSPLIILGTLALLLGSILVVGPRLAIIGDTINYAAAPAKMLSILNTSPISLGSGLLFCLSCLFLNSFLVLVTAPHWLRMWIFGNKETRLQVRALTGTCVVWLMLIGIGALAAASLSEAATPGSSITHEANEVVVAFLMTLVRDGSPLFAVAFWVAGMAALFASADVQIYAFWLIERFDVNKGEVAGTSFARIRPMIYAAIAAGVFSALYGVVRHYHVPFDRLVLVLLPSCLTIVPSLVLAMRGVPQQPIFAWVSVVLYALFAGLGLRTDLAGESFAVAAPLMPLLISVVAAIYRPKQEVARAPA